MGVREGFFRSCAAWHPPELPYAQTSTLKPMSTLRRVAKTVQRTYRRAFEREADEETRRVMGALRQAALFQELPRAALRELAEAVHARRYLPDEPIYYEGDPGLGCYVVRRGRVRLMTEDEHGAPHELRQVGEHEVFGGLSILGDFRRMETAQAMTEAHVLGFFRPDLETLTKRHPEAGAAITGALARHGAAQQAELFRLVAARDGKVPALRMLEDAALSAARPGHAPAAPESSTALDGR